MQYNGQNENECFRNGELFNRSKQQCSRRECSSHPSRERLFGGEGRGGAEEGRGSGGDETGILQVPAGAARRKRKAQPMRSLGTPPDTHKKRHHRP